ncbi:MULTISPECIES: heme exporter protein CcmD [Methylobacterium]|uniref:heme exporter protein CcmD n=1 Tax=Methylobacterium TaxID=407 RepID=UPI0009EB33B3|nr:MULTISPECIES: heme exporter protein CcmD [Methylobacterium]MCI9880959.1 heme exporter protein CcmD [Methylobacterium goesingense]
MNLGQHAGYILGAYAFATLVIAGLVVHGLRDHRAQKRALERLQGELKDDAGGRS